MGRKPRIEYYGAIYHIVQKEKDGGLVFKDEEDKSQIIEIINEAKIKYDYRIFAYVIMGNHYHLLIQTLNIPISKIMHYINSGYAKYYNSKYSKEGSVFGRRYKSIIIKNEKTIPSIIKYIHLNPVKHNTCKSIMEYNWSSDPFYRVNVEGIVDIAEILNTISRNRIEAIEKYVEFMDDGDFDKVNYVNKDGFLIDRSRQNQALDELLLDACPSKEEYKEIKEGSRKRHLTQFKKKYVYEGRKAGYTFNDIGKNIGVTGAAVRYLLKSG